MKRSNDTKKVQGHFNQKGSELVLRLSSLGESLMPCLNDQAYKAWFTSTRGVYHISLIDEYQSKACFLKVQWRTIDDSRTLTSWSDSIMAHVIHNRHCELKLIAGAGGSMLFFSLNFISQKWLFMLWTNRRHSVHRHNCLKRPS